MNSQFKRNLDYDNYIILYFNKDCYYPYGFVNIYRNDIDFIINKKNKKKKYTKEESLNVTKDYGIEIHFNKYINSLYHFFDSEKDENMINLRFVDFNFFNTISISNVFSLFHSCSSLESIDLSNFDTSKVTDMYSMFSGCSSLKSIYLSNFKTPKVTDMGYMFYGCSSLKSIDLSSFDTSKVTRMGWMFSECSSLKSIYLSSFDTSNITNMGGMFSGCSSLKSIVLSNFDTSKVTDMSWMFSGCSSLESIDLKFDMINCNSYENMFLDIRNIKYINLYYLKNDKIISKVFNNINNSIFVCQKDIIIDNSKAYNCCDSNFRAYNCISKATYFKPKIGFFITFFTIIFSCICNCLCKKQVYSKKKTFISNRIKPNIIEHEPQNDKDNPIKIIFQNPGIGYTSILIDSKETIDELIKFYFEACGRPDLYGDETIFFLVNGKSIVPPYPKDFVETLKNKFVNSGTIKIGVNDRDDKMK